MNFINKPFLKLALLPSFFYRRMGIDTVQLKSILITKLIMDDRRPNALQQARQRKKEKPVSRATLGTMLISAVIGALYLLAFNVGIDMLTHLTIYYTLFFFMLSLTLIADFTSVLIDIRDNYIILPKPVNDRTVVVARLLHIFIHLCKIVAPLSLAGIIYMAIKYGLYASVLFLFLLLLTTFLSLFFINALYILILRFTTPQRFQSIISYVQIIFAIVMYGSYQVFPRMINLLQLDTFTFQNVKGIEAYPIYWLANSWQFFSHFKGSVKDVALALAGLAFPFVAIFVVIRYLAPSFNKKLALLNSSSGAPEKTNASQKKIKTSISTYISKLFTHTKAENASFLFTWKMTSRSRDFKVKVYPFMGYMVVYMVVLFINSKSLSLYDFQEESSKGKALILSAVYITSYMLIVAVGQIYYSDKFKAAWLYYTTPIETPGEIISGAVKAILVKFYTPIIVVITISTLLFIGPRVLPNIILGACNEVLFLGVTVYISNKYFPFSAQQNTSAKTGTFLRSFSILLISGLIGFAHYLIYSSLPAVIICAVLSIIAAWLLLDSIKRIGWNKMETTIEQLEGK